MLCGITDDLIRDSGDQWKKNDARQKLCRETIEANNGKDQNADDHHDEQEAGSAARVKRRESSGVVDIQFLAGFEVVNRLVLRAVILEDTIHIFHPRH